MKNIDEAHFIEIFAVATETDPAEYSIDTEIAGLPTWDSIAVLNFIVAVEDKYGIILNLDQLADCARLRELYTLVVKGAA